MGLIDWLWRRPSQLDQIQTQLDRMETHMSTQEQDLNDALAGFFTATNEGLDRIEAKLAETAPSVDLTDEIAAIKDAQAAFQARVDIDAPATPPPAEEPTE